MKEKELRYPDQRPDCQKFEGQQYPWQHAHPGPVKNAMRCGICDSNADKLRDNEFVCQSDPTHIGSSPTIWVVHPPTPDNKKG